MLETWMDQFERASAAYGARHGFVRDGDWFLLKLLEEAGEVVQVVNRLQGRSRAQGLEPQALRRQLADETADLLGHVLLLARHHGLDLASAVERKWHFCLAGEGAKAGVDATGTSDATGTTDAVGVPGATGA